MGEKILSITSSGSILFTRISAARMMIIINIIRIGRMERVKRLELREINMHMHPWSRLSFFLHFHFLGVCPATGLSHSDRNRSHRRNPKGGVGRGDEIGVGRGEEIGVSIDYG